MEDYNFYLNSLDNNANYIGNIPKKFKTYELCLKAIDNGCYYLHYIPGHHRTYELCFKSLKHIYDGFKYVPYEHKDLNMCKEAFKYFDIDENDIPKKFRSYEFYLNIVKEKPLRLRAVPDRFKTEILCLIAYKKYYSIKRIDHYAFYKIEDFFPKKFKNKELKIEKWNDKTHYSIKHQEFKRVLFTLLMCLNKQYKDNMQIYLNIFSFLYDYYFYII
jgi:hypothetical protein